ncbi:MAG: ABC transporter permease [Bacillota bacterium]|nr:ABC transporter permease [Bacillota bacterium]
MFNKIGDIQWMAMHNLWRQRTRNAIMAGVLALGITAYLVVVPIMDALAEKAVARTQRLDMPCDLALVMNHMIRYQEFNEIDPTQNKEEMICPAAQGARRLPWDALKGFARVEFAALEQAYSPAGSVDVLYASPQSTWFLRAINIESGKAPASRDEVIVPVWFARRARVTVGSTLTLVFPYTPLHRLEDHEFTVTGVFSTDFALADAPVIWEDSYHQHELSELTEYGTRGSGARMLAMFDLGGARTDAQAAIRDLRSAFEALNASVAGGRIWYTFQASTGLVPNQAEITARTLTQDIQMPAINALFLAFVFVAVGLFTVMLLSFYDRRRDIAIMKTVGIGNSDVASVIIAEIAIVTIAGVLVAAGLSSFAVKSLSGSVWAGVLEVKWVNILKGAAVGFLVMAFSAAFPVSLAHVATVNQLLYDQRIYLFHRKITRTVNAPAGRPRRLGR